MYILAAVDCVSRMWVSETWGAISIEIIIIISIISSTVASKKELLVSLFP